MPGAQVGPCGLSPCCEQRKLSHDCDAEKGNSIKEGKQVLGETPRVCVTVRLGSRHLVAAATLQGTIGASAQPAGRSQR